MIDKRIANAASRVGQRAISGVDRSNTLPRTANCPSDTSIVPARQGNAYISYKYTSPPAADARRRRR